MSHQSARQWILKAESDLKIGRDELATEKPARDAICFHMQQPRAADEGVLRRVLYGQLPGLRGRGAARKALGRPVRPSSAASWRGAAGRRGGRPGGRRTPSGEHVVVYNRANEGRGVGASG